MGVKVTIIKMNVLNHVFLMTFVSDGQCNFLLMLNSQNCFRSVDVLQNVLIFRNQSLKLIFLSVFKLSNQVLELRLWTRPPINKSKLFKITDSPVNSFSHDTP